MLETNLATRPFYNERAVHLGLAMAAVAIAALTAFNVRQIRHAVRAAARARVRVEADRRVAEAARREAARRRAGLDGTRLSAAATAVREANVIIGQPGLLLVGPARHRRGTPCRPTCGSWP